MSYCRWSTPIPGIAFTSDVYIYDHVEGHISVNVAAARQETAGGPFTDIKLPHAGAVIPFTDPMRCVAFLMDLKALGYRVPDRVLDLEIYGDTYERA